MQTDNNLILDHLNDPIFHLIGEVADEMNRPCFVIGGYVRDIFLVTVFYLCCSEVPKCRQVGPFPQFGRYSLGEFYAAA